MGRHAGGTANYNRDFHYARKLGLSVKEFREQLDAGTLADPRPPMKIYRKRAPLCNDRKIYGLVDPREPAEFRVIGETKQLLLQRLYHYLSDARRDRKSGKNLCPSAVWVLELLDGGVRPEIRLIEPCTQKNWRAQEIAAIAFYRGKGHRLLNQHAGGNGSEHGGRREFCGKCGTRKETFPSGWNYCPKCGKSRDRSAERVAYNRDFNRDQRHAKKLGVSVNVFRELVATGRIPDPRGRRALWKAKMIRTTRVLLAGTRVGCNSVKVQALTD